MLLGLRARACCMYALVARHVCCPSLQRCAALSHSTWLSYMALQVWLPSLSAPGKDSHIHFAGGSFQHSSLSKACKKLLLQQLLRWLEKPQSAFYVPGTSLKSCLWDSAGLSGSTRGAEPEQTDAHHMRTSLAHQIPWWGHSAVHPHGVPHALAHLAISLTGGQTAPEWAQPREVAGLCAQAPWPCVQLPTDYHVEQGAISFARLYFKLPALIFPAFWDGIKLLSKDF